MILLLQRLGLLMGFNIVAQDVAVKYARQQQYVDKTIYASAQVRILLQRLGLPMLKTIGSPRRCSKIRTPAAACCYKVNNILFCSSTYFTATSWATYVKNHR